VSAMECGLLPLAQTSMRFLHIAYHDFEGIADNVDERERLVKDLGDNEAMILRTAEHLVKRGVKVRVLTNSLASNDVAAAHAGYEKYRKKLLEAGVEVYELRPDAGQVRKEWSITGGRSIAALHTKALVVDRRSTFVGSFNLDPRSANINTEVGLLIESPELAQEVASYLDGGVEADNAYHVTLDARGHTRWSASVDGQVVTYDHEPQTSAWKRFTADVIRILPIDSQL